MCRDREMWYDNDCNILTADSRMEKAMECDYLKQKKILLVDDEEQLRDMVHRRDMSESGRPGR